MNRLMQYIQESFPPFLYAFPSLFLTLSGLMVNDGAIGLIAFFVSLFGMMLFFSLKQMMNDALDYKKDCAVYPHRPLPKRLIDFDAFRNQVNRIHTLMFLYGLIVWLFFNFEAAALYLLTALYLWHLFRGFFLGGWIERHPFLRLIAWQIAIIPIALFPIALMRPQMVFTYPILAYAYMIFGAFLVFSLSRQLSPDDHASRGACLQCHGYAKVFIFFIAALFISAIGALAVGVEYMLWPVEFAILAAFIVLFFDPKRYALVEVLAKVSLWLHMGAGVVQYLIFTR